VRTRGSDTISRNQITKLICFLADFLFSFAQTKPVEVRSENSFAFIFCLTDLRTRQSAEISEVSEMPNYGFANFESKVYLAQGIALEQGIG